MSQKGLRMTETEIREHITWLLTIISNLRSAILALSTGNEKSYSLNTGQTTQSVTRKDLGDLRVQLKAFVDELTEYREIIGESTTETGGEIMRAL